MRAFLDANGYPFDCWSVENLKLALLVRVGTPSETYAWVWFNWLHVADKALEMHVCASRRRRGEWIAPAMTHQITTLVEMLGTTFVLARLPRAARFMQHLGFEVIGNTAFKFINQEKEEAPDGSTVWRGPEAHPGTPAD